jgi:hypothetical protein
MATMVLAARDAVSIYTIPEVDDVAENAVRKSIAPETRKSQHCVMRVTSGSPHSYLAPLATVEA